MAKKGDDRGKTAGTVHRLPSAKEIKGITAKIRKVFPGVSDDFVTKLVSAFLSGQFKWNFLKKYPIPHAVADDEKLGDYVTVLKKKMRIRGPALARIAYDGRLSQDEFLLGQKQKRPPPAARGKKAPGKREILVSSKLRRAPLAFLEHVVVHEFAHFREKEHDKRFQDLCAEMQPDFLKIEIDLLWFLFYKDVMKEDMYGAG
jgi:UTP pyrophosphatase